VALGEQVVYEVPKPPLQPVYYHYEILDPECTGVSSIPFCIPPPTPPEPEIQDPKLKSKKAAEEAKKTAAAKPGGAKGGKGGAPPTPRQGEGGGGLGTLARGSLRMKIRVEMNEGTRDWLRNGEWQEGEYGQVLEG
jgi:hypothetical protein